MQEDKTLQQMIREHEMNMPPEIMNLINSFDWKKEVRTVVNQNQLMIDTGADLEQSIYLMLLGAIGAPDLYERLVEAHEVPEDKAQKILQEIESQIFIPLHTKLMEMDKNEKSKEAPSATNTVSSAPRDQILAEIEKEPEPLIKLNFNKTEQAPAQKVEFADSADSGIVKPFTISQTSTPTVAPVIEQVKPETSIVKPVTETPKDPVATNLTTPTVAVNPAQTPKPYSADPYREPIE